MSYHISCGILEFTTYALQCFYAVSSASGTESSLSISCCSNPDVYVGIEPSRWSIWPVYFGASPKPGLIGKAATGRASGIKPQLLFICSPLVCHSSSCNIVCWHARQWTGREDRHRVGGLSWGRMKSTDYSGYMAVK